MEELAGLISTYGVPSAVIIWLVVGLLRLIEKLAPDALRFLKRRQEGRFAGEAEERRMEHLERLANQGSRTFMEEQLTSITDATQGQVQMLLEVLAKKVAMELDLHTQLLIQIRDEIRERNSGTPVDKGVNPTK